MATKQRLNVSFTDTARTTLEKLAAEKGKGYSEVLRDAIALEDWLEETKRSGGRIFVQGKDGTLREVVFR